MATGDHHLVGVMASPTRKAVGGVTVWRHAEKMGCPTWPTELVKDPGFAEVVRAEKVDILPQCPFAISSSSRRSSRPRGWGASNLHPGPLPRYAGLTLRVGAITEVSAVRCDVAQNAGGD